MGQNNIPYYQKKVKDTHKKKRFYRYLGAVRQRKLNKKYTMTNGNINNN